MNIREVIRAATRPYGFMPFCPGPGLRGHCIPIDPYYLTWKANEVGRPTRFIELADDTHESPSFEIIHRLRELGAKADYHDPHLPRALPVRRHVLKLSSVALTRETVAGYDAIVISTNHSNVDYRLLADCANLVVDTSDAMREFRSDMGDRLVSA